VLEGAFSDPRSCTGPQEEGPGARRPPVSPRGIEPRERLLRPRTTPSLIGPPRERGSSTRYLPPVGWGRNSGWSPTYIPFRHPSASRSSCAGRPRRGREVSSMSPSLRPPPCRTAGRLRFFFFFFFGHGAKNLSRGPTSSSKPRSAYLGGAGRLEMCPARICKPGGGAPDQGVSSGAGGFPASLVQSGTAARFSPRVKVVKKPVAIPRPAGPEKCIAWPCSLPWV